MLKLAKQHISEKEFEVLWASFDLNNDGFISEHEFHHGLQWLAVHIAASAKAGGGEVEILTSICKSLLGAILDTANRAHEKGANKTASLSFLICFIYINSWYLLIRIDCRLYRFVCIAKC